MKPRAALVVLGSSGGHVFPGLAIARAMQRQEPSLKIFVAYSSGKDKKLRRLAACEFPVFGFSLGGLAGGQSLMARLKTAFQIPGAFLAACRLIWMLRADLVFGAGGSLSGLFILAAWMMRRKACLWEGNRSYGLANRLSLPFVSKAFTVFGRNPKGKKQMPLGYPLRADFERPPRRQDPSFKAAQSGAHDSSDAEGGAPAAAADAGKTLSASPPVCWRGAPGGRRRLRRRASSQAAPATVDAASTLSAAAAMRQWPAGQGASKPAAGKPAPGPPAAAGLQGPKPFQVLILGGSQGALSLNRPVFEALEDRSWRDGIFFLHQTGAAKGGIEPPRPAAAAGQAPGGGGPRLAEAVSAAWGLEQSRSFDGGVRFNFARDMRPLIEAADLIFSRAGSGAIAEAAAIGRPLALIPLPASAGGRHQEESALALKAAARLIFQKDFTAETFKALTLELKGRPAERARLSAALKKLHRPYGAEDIARAASLLAQQA